MINNNDNDDNDNDNYNDNNNNNDNDKIVCKVILCFWANGCHIAAATKLPLKSLSQA